MNLPQGNRNDGDAPEPRLPRALIDLWMDAATTPEDMQQGIDAALWDLCDVPRSEERSGEPGSAVTHLSADFPSFDDQYRASEELWRELVEELARSRGQEGDWEPWIPGTYWDGTPRPRDGDPIFHARAEELGRGVRIIQFMPLRGGVEISAWLHRFDYSRCGGPGPTVELNIGCALSEEVVSIARPLIARWMDESTTPEAMQAAIDRTLDGTC